MARRLQSAITKFLPVDDGTVLREALKVRVAAIAQADQVGQAIGVSIVGHAEEPEWPDVMHIQCPPQVRFADSAELAVVAIAASGVSLLALPVCAVITRLAAPPCRVRARRPVLGLPGAETRSAAKSVLADPCPAGPCDRLAAAVARLGFRWPKTGRGAADVGRSHTRTRAIAICSAVCAIRRRAPIGLSADCADDFRGDYMLRHPSTFADRLVPRVHVGASGLCAFPCHKCNSSGINAVFAGDGSEIYMAVKEAS